MPGATRRSADASCGGRRRAGARRVGARFLCGVSHASPSVPSPARPHAVPREWLRGATLAAAVTLGALVGFGLHDGASLSRLSAVALRLRGLPEFVAPDRRAVGAALVGGVQASIVGGAWGAGLAALAGALAHRGVAPRVAAVAAATIALAVVDAVLPTPLRLAAGALAPAERVLTAALVAGAAWAGRRLAEPAT